MQIEPPPRDDATWIQLVSGKQFWPLNPDPLAIEPADIAHALSMICRYTGHTRGFYSVSQHSWLMWQEAKRLGHGAIIRKWCLLHDATEAYIFDVSRPIKKHLPDYQAIEQRLEQAVAERFALPLPLPIEVKRLDNVLLATERRDLMKPPPRPWTQAVGVDPLPDRIYCFEWADAKHRLERAFEEENII